MMIILFWRAFSSTTYEGGKVQNTTEIERTCLPVKLFGDEDVLNVRVVPCSDGHGRILEQRNATLELRDLLDAQLAFFRHSSRKSPCILLHIPNMALQ